MVIWPLHMPAHPGMFIYLFFYAEIYCKDLRLEVAKRRQEHHAIGRTNQG